MSFVQTRMQGMWKVYIGETKFNATARMNQH